MRFPAPPPTLRRRALAVLVALLFACPLLPAQPSLYWHDARTKQILRAPLAGGMPETLVDPAIQHPASLALDTLHRKLYWIERDTGTIKRSSYEGQGVETVAEEDGSYRTDLLLNSAAGYVYWQEVRVRREGNDVWPESAAIKRARLDGSGAETLFSNGTEEFFDFALDAQRGWLFLSADYHVEKVDLSSGHRDTLLTYEDGISTFTDFAYDASSQTLFWAHKNLIGRTRADGTDKRVLMGSIWFGDGVRYSTGLTVDAAGQRLYWLHSGRLRSARLDGTDLQTHLTTGILYADLAFSTAQRRFYLADHWSGAIQSYSEGAATPTDVLRSEIYGVMDDLVFDPSGNALYWTAKALNDGRVQRLDLETLQVSSVVKGLANPGRLTLDERHQKLYWTEPGAARVRRADVDGTGVETVIEPGNGVAGPLALDVPRNHLYWLTFDTSDEHLLYRASLGGAGREVVATLTSPFFEFAFAMDMAMDAEGQYLYLTSRDEGKVQRVVLATGTVEDVAEMEGQRPTALAYNAPDRMLYWVDEASSTLYQREANRPGAVMPAPAAEGRRVTDFALDPRVLAGVPYAGGGGAAVIFPNPARTLAKVVLRVAEAQHVEADLFDALGRHVETLYRGPLRADTEYAIPVDVQRLGAGLYFCRIRGETYHATQRVVVVR